MVTCIIGKDSGKGDPFLRTSPAAGLTLCVCDGVLYYTVIDASGARALWRVREADAETPACEKVADVGEALASGAGAVVRGRTLYLPGRDRTLGYGVYETDGFETTFWPVAEAHGAPRLYATESRLYWAVDQRLRVGEAHEARALDTPPLWTGQAWADFNDLLFFAVRQPNGVPVLWRTDGTDAGTFGLLALTGDPNAAFDLQMQALPAGLSGLCFNTQTDANSTGLWITDGTLEGTRSLAQMSATAEGGLRLHQFHRFMNRNLYFLANERLMRYHGITGTVAELLDSQGNPAPEHIVQIAPASDKLMIVTDHPESGQGLWTWGPRD